MEMHVPVILHWPSFFVRASYFLNPGVMYTTVAGFRGAKAASGQSPVRPLA